MPQIGLNYSTFKVSDSYGFSDMCPEQQEQDHDEVQRYKLVRLCDHYN